MSPRRGSSVLVTVLFTDVVGSTEIGAELGDRRWRELMRRHHQIVRRSLKTHDGRELDTAGDGFFVSFERPADAIRCACAISDGVRELGIEIRAGLHVGEAEVVEHKVGGITVNVGSRVEQLASAGEVLVSSTLRDAVVGSGFGFADCGLHRLKGIEGEWRLYAVTAIDGDRRPRPASELEARERRGFVELTPAPRRRERLVAGGLAGLVVVAVLAAILTNAFRGTTQAQRDRPTNAERALLSIIPADFRSRCSRSLSPPPRATAVVDCSPNEWYSVSYARYGSTDDLERAFDAFASPADPTQFDCARDPSARSEYSINGVRAGEVACYTDEGTNIGTADSVIVWTEEPSHVLGRAIRGDAADLTLYKWWRERAGPWEPEGAHPPKSGDPPRLLRGVFRPVGHRGWLKFSDGRFATRFPFWGETNFAELLFAKPSTLLLYHRLSPVHSGPGACSNYEEYRWQLRGRHLNLDLVTGGCSAYGSGDISGATFTKV